MTRKRVWKAPAPPQVREVSPLEFAEELKVFFRINSNTVIGHLKPGEQPQDEYAKEFHVQCKDSAFLEALTNEVCRHAVTSRVLGCQAYAALRVAVFQCLPVDKDNWPNYMY